MKKNNSGQVTLFVIIGVILILVVGILFFSGGFDFILDRSSAKDRVSDIVEKCIYDSASRGVFLLGFQGGYIEIPEYKLADPRKHVDFGLKIPNWDSEVDDIPSISSMEFSLENFILEDAYACINGNLNVLDDVVNLDYSENLFVSTEINPENVAVEVNFPLTFNELNSEELVSIQDFFVNLEDLRLGDLFELAGIVYSDQASSNVIETLIMEQIYGASDYGSRESMPTEGMVLSCSPQIWTLPQLKENLAQLNNNNFKYLQFEGTYSKDYIFNANLNDEFGTSEFKTYYENKYNFDLSVDKPSYNNYLVEVMMPSTEITGETGYFQKYPYRTFEVTPSEGQIVKPINLEIISDLGPEIPIPCVQIYHTLYDLDYDLIVRVTDMSNDANKYMFQFPLRVKIEGNNPKQAINVPIDLSESGIKTATDEKFCQEDSREYPVTVYALDKLSGEYLDDVNVSYECIDLSCNVGETKKLSYNGYEYGNFPFLSTNFPYCQNGRVVAEKNGYFRGEVNIDTTDAFFETGQKSQPVTVELTPTKSFSVDESSFLIVYDGSGHRVYSDDEDKSIFVSVTNKGIGYSQNLIWPSYENSYTGDLLFNEIEFLDDEDIAYNLSLYYQDEEGMKGLMELKNWKPNIHSGNNIFFTVFGSSTEITEDDFLSYYENMETLIESGSYGVDFR